MAERYGWGDEWMIAPAMVTIAETMVWTGEYDEGELWLRRAQWASQADSGPGIRLLLHLVTGMLRACRGRHHEALRSSRPPNVAMRSWWARLAWPAG